jgi:hypothetical protein
MSHRRIKIENDQITILELYAKNLDFAQIKWGPSMQLEYKKKKRRQRKKIHFEENFNIEGLK